jgi:3-isopropylmalate dehydratase small subunit
MQEQGKHCMESLDPAFASNAKPGDFIVAGTDFGCGSSTPARLAKERQAVSSNS